MIRSDKIITGFSTTRQEMVREKQKLLMVREFYYFESGKIDILKKSRGKLNEFLTSLI